MSEFINQLRVKHGEHTIITLDAVSGAVIAGGDGTIGELKLEDDVGHGRPRLILRADDGLRIRYADGSDLAVLDGRGRLTLGEVNHPGHARLKNADGEVSVHLDGEQGCVYSTNADFAEEFDLCDTAVNMPGAVMVINGDGELEPCTEAYDSRVVGVIAGAGRYRPGIVLDKKTGRHRATIAMVGKVECLADAANGPIRAGDLLTTSERKGYAMKATDREHTPGTVIGKALSPLTEGEGLVRMVIWRV